MPVAGRAVARPGPPGAAPGRPRGRRHHVGRLRPDPQHRAQGQPQGGRDRAGRQQRRPPLRQRQNKVPDVVGKDEATARNQLEQAGFTVPTARRAGVGRPAPGTVLSQTPAAGETSRLGSTVTDHGGRRAARDPDTDRRHRPTPRRRRPPTRRAPRHQPADPFLTGRGWKAHGAVRRRRLARVRRRHAPAPGPRRARGASGSPQVTSQLASSRWPPSVSTDSGWNCTPSSGRSRCRSAMTTPLAVRPVTSSSAGRLSSRTASEW